MPEDNSLWPAPAGTTGDIIPLNRDPYGVLHFAAPNMLRGAVNSAYNALVGPGEVLTGRSPSGDQVNPDPQQIAQDIAFSGLAVTSPLPGIPGGFSSFKGWHGTPHVFEPVEHNPFGEFRDEAIGSGEGAQVYGHGHYVAGARAVAEDYAKNLTDTKNLEIKFNGAPLTWDHIPEEADVNLSPELFAKKRVLLYGGDPDAAWTDLNKEVKFWTRQVEQESLPAGMLGDPVNAATAARNWLLENKSKFERKDPSGNLLHLEITPEEHELLDWDRPLSNNHPALMEKIKTIAPGHIGDAEVGDQTTGEDFYHYLAEQANDKLSPHPTMEASRILKEAGIPGIKYLDQFSRDKTGTSNDIRVTNVGDNKYELRAYNKGSGQKFTRDELHDSLSEDDLRQILGPEVSSDIFNQLDKSKLGSRATSSGPVEFPGTHNYVIFDPKHIRIIGRNGERLKMEPVEEDPFK